jgi:hypothetical protein
LGAGEELATKNSSKTRKSGRLWMEVRRTFWVERSSGLETKGVFEVV